MVSGRGRGVPDESGRRVDSVSAGVHAFCPWGNQPGTSSGARCARGRRGGTGAAAPEGESGVVLALSGCGTFGAGEIGASGVTAVESLAAGAGARTAESRPAESRATASPVSVECGRVAAGLGPLAAAA